MREIKFRAQRIDNHPSVWVYGYLVKTPITAEFNDADGAYFDSGKSRYCIVTEHGVAHEIDINTLGEYTGSKDRDGVEIYEGDIFIDDDTGEIDYAKVEWFEGGWNASPWFGPQEFFTEAESYAVIGNIFEDPDLLKE